MFQFFIVGFDIESYILQSESMEDWLLFRSVTEPKVTVVNLTTDLDYEFCVKAKNEECTGPGRETDPVTVQEQIGIQFTVSCSLHEHL